MRRNISNVLCVIDAPLFGSWLRAAQSHFGTAPAPGHVRQVNNLVFWVDDATATRGQLGGRIRFGYGLWNQSLWRSLNNTYPIFLTPCIRCTNHLCDSCNLTDVNRHFIPSLLRMVQNCWPIVTSSIQEPVASNCGVTMTDCSRVVAMDAFLAQWWGQWSQHSGRPRTCLAIIS